MECRMHVLPYVKLRGENWKRCRACGHRRAHATKPHRKVRHTRARWPWFWATEIINRRRARRAKWIQTIGGRNTTMHANVIKYHENLIRHAAMIPPSPPSPPSGYQFQAQSGSSSWPPPRPELPQ